MIIAIEGPSFAGKSTLIKGLSTVLDPSFTYFPCYVKYAKNTFRGHQIPEGLYPTIEQQIEATKFFLNLEKERYFLMKAAINNTHFIVDRSFYTLLAHSYALENGYGCTGLFSQAESVILNQNEKLIPDHIILLKVPQTELEQRFNNFKPAIFKEAKFNDLFKGFFEIYPLNNLYIIDGIQSIEKTQNIAEIYLNSIGI